MYLLKLAMRPWRMAAPSQIFAAIAVGVLLTLSGFLYWIQEGLRPVLSRLQGEQVITAYLEEGLDPQEEPRVVDQVRVALGAKDAPEVRLVTTEQFISGMKGEFPDLARELEGLGPDLRSVVPRYVSASGVFPSSALEKVRNVPGVMAAETSKDRYQHIVGAFRALRWVARILAMGLAIAILTGLMHLSRINAYLHRDSLSLLRFWGAGPGTLRAPALITGLTVGLVGGALGTGGWFLFGTWLARQVRALSPMLREMPVATPELARIGVALFLTGVVAGLLAGWVSGGRAEPDGAFARADG